MQGRGGGRGPFSDMGDPFAGFGGFGSFGPPGGTISSIFGGRDPFDDPFFTQPLARVLGAGPFCATAGFPFPRGMHPSGFPEHQGPAMHPSGFLEYLAPELNRRRGPIIQELDSDDENEGATEEKKGNPRKHSRSDEETDEEHPDDEIDGKRSKRFQARNKYDRINLIGSQSQGCATVNQPQSGAFYFQSSTVSCGGPNGTYYTSSRTRRSGSDGVTFEESKEADSSTRQASHRVSRGIHGKGHSLSRKLNSDGKVDTMQTLHNINEDELAGFEEEWKGKGQMYLPVGSGNIGVSFYNNGQAQPGSGVWELPSGVWTLPSTEHNHNVGTISEARGTVGSSHTQERRPRTASCGRNAHCAGRRG